MKCMACRKRVDLPHSLCFVCATGRTRDPRIIALAERPRRSAWREYDRIDTGEIQDG
jgi:hypothetical protein